MAAPKGSATSCHKGTKATKQQKLDPKLLWFKCIYTTRVEIMRPLYLPQNSLWGLGQRLINQWATQITYSHRFLSARLLTCQVHWGGNRSKSNPWTSQWTSQAPNWREILLTCLLTCQVHWGARVNEQSLDKWLGKLSYTLTSNPTGFPLYLTNSLVRINQPAIDEQVNGQVKPNIHPKSYWLACWLANFTTFKRLQPGQVLKSTPTRSGQKKASHATRHITWNLSLHCSVLLSEIGQRAMSGQVNRGVKAPIDVKCFWITCWLTSISTRAEAT